MTYEGDFVEGTPYGVGTIAGMGYFYKGTFKSGIFDGKGSMQDTLRNT
jgi:hypothetical protein